MSLHQAQLLVVSIEPYGEDYVNVLRELLVPRLASITPRKTMPEIQQILQQVFQESVRQIFDYMSRDFQDFGLRILSLPNYERFVAFHALPEKAFVAEHLSPAIKELAVGIYFCLQNNGVFKTYEDFLLDHPDPNHVIIRWVV